MKAEDEVDDVVLVLAVVVVGGRGCGGRDTEEECRVSRV